MSFGVALTSSLISVVLGLCKNYGWLKGETKFAHLKTTMMTDLTGPNFFAPVSKLGLYSEKKLRTIAK